MSVKPNSTDEYHFGGSVPVDSPIYVRRQADSDLFVHTFKLDCAKSRLFVEACANRLGAVE